MLRKLLIGSGMTSRPPLILTVIATGIVFCWSRPLAAQTTTFLPASGDYNTSANWSSGVPNGTAAVIANGKAATIFGSGSSAPPPAGGITTLTLNGGFLIANQSLLIAGANGRITGNNN